MKKALSISAALLLTLGLTEGSLAQGRGNDKGAGPDKHEGRGDQDNPGKGKGKGRDDNGDRRDDNGDRRQESRNEERRGPGDGRGRDQDRDKDRDKDRDRDRPVIVVTPERNDRVIVVDRDHNDRIIVVDRDRGLIAGCPPGLAKRNNGCLPPGQERKLERDAVRRVDRDEVRRLEEARERELARARYDWLWSRRSDDYDYRYDDGYLYRYDRQGSLLGYLPALAGALSVGNLWPNQYRYDPAPSYYSSYYQLDDPYDYRYADGALYGVNRQTNTIQSIAALLTGQSPGVGQRMPGGYDIYNVPYDYRDQYRDSADSLYRYNDGAVYQLDPKTQVIQAIIQLLT